jgi:hypothetical protein
MRRLRSCRAAACGVAAALACPASALAQDGRLTVSGFAAVLNLTELDTTDPGIGGGVSWRIGPVLAVDGMGAWFSGGDGPGSDSPTSVGEPLGDRVLIVAGIRAGRSLGRAEVFATARPGFLRFVESGESLCITLLIYPSPLTCQLAAGYTAFAFDAGAGANIALDEARRIRLEVEVSDLMVRYGLDAYRTGGDVTDGFTGHNLFFTAGVGWRF